MEDKGPRNLRGLVQPRDMAEFLGVPEPTFRVWRKRRQEWVEKGRPKSRAVHTLLPEPVRDPENPSEPFMINGAFVYDVSDVIKLRDEIVAHERKAGNPNIASLNVKDPAP
ncbi:hypothetical protein [Pseudarthrobacter phenanthrenivorans]|uniref:Uncharacterized protein n=1 Tax=Pseudarthrobacter phenanthrenivorans TaxID=361575 RepID=A0A0B4DIN7_PSEPS|nr:hypothetical protein [Pseudarthrobacter phenanthrenivorans]KIC68697.1 hypothetical protein RM50_04350 [Pseudarthrobacter phenanthrenivorans]